MLALRNWLMTLAVKGGFLEPEALTLFALLELISFPCLAQKYLSLLQLYGYAELYLFMEYTPSTPPTGVMVTPTETGNTGIRS